MPTYKAVRNKNRCPSHPGAVISDILQDIDKTKSEIASLLGISRQQLYDILTEKKPLSAQVSVRIAKLFGGSPESWLRMQASHDAWHAERSVDVSKIPTLQEACYPQRPRIDPRPSRPEVVHPPFRLWILVLSRLGRSQISAPHIRRLYSSPPRRAGSRAHS